jgi:pimeloyl-ACP methyl ester carboxylesterase/DNA-binding CsgD family transcriptional regulator
MSNPDPQTKVELIDHIYDVALDPMRYEQLLDAWESRMAPLRGGNTHDDVGPDLLAHAARASEFLDRLKHPIEEESLHARLATEIAAAFCVGKTGSIIEFNPAAKNLFGMQAGGNINVLLLERGEKDKLAEAILAATGKTKKASLLRFSATDSERAVIFHIAPISTPAGETVALVRTSELGWPDSLTQLLKEAFKLTLAEVEIVRNLVEGKSLKEISTDRDRSFDTVRGQVKSILSKTETRSQTELIRIVLSLMEVVASAAQSNHTHVHEPRSLEPIPFQTMVQPGGRRYDWIEFGDPKGRACIYLPIDYGLTRWPLTAQREAKKRNIRVIVPVRAGYGHSSPMPPKIDYAGETGADVGRLLDHLGIAKVAMLTLGADFRYALRLANARPNLVSGILACAGTLPTLTARQYERMGKWHRFILANARYAPLILPFLVKAGFSLARRIGKVQFLNAVNADSPSDLKTYADPEVREAMLLGSEICLSDWHIAHEAFARECIDSETDWSHVVRQCQVPVRMLQGDEDPQSPRKTIEELIPEFPNLDISIIDNCGQLLFFKEWRMALDELEAFLPKAGV